MTTPSRPVPPLTRRAVALGLAALGCALAAPAALAQGGFPSKPITFVVPYPAAKGVLKECALSSADCRI